MDDELGCHWADPALRIPWEISEVKLSERDSGSGVFSDLLRELEPWQPIGQPSR